MDYLKKPPWKKFFFDIFAIHSSSRHEKRCQISVRLFSLFPGSILGLTLWNLSCLEFKFDDTRLSYWHKNKIGRIEIFFCCFLTLLIFCPVSWVSFAETSQQGRKLAKSGSNKKKFQFCQSYSYVNRKVWYHQIWIPNNLGFMVLIQIYIHTLDPNVVAWNILWTSRFTWFVSWSW